MIERPHLGVRGGRGDAARITFEQPDGLVRTVDGRVGYNLMQVAVRAEIAGIDAACGGNCCCVTCQVIVAPSWLAAIGKPSPMEESMLDFAENLEPGSRLACQIAVTADLDGLRVRIPHSQRVLGF